MRPRATHPSTLGQGTSLLPTSFVHITRHTMIRKFKVKFATAAVFSIRARFRASLSLPQDSLVNPGGPRNSLVMLIG